PFEPPGTLVETADEHQEIVRGGVDAGSEVDDRAVELVDGGVTIDRRKGIRVDVHRGAPWAMRESVILSRLKRRINDKLRILAQFMCSLGRVRIACKPAERPSSGGKTRTTTPCRSTRVAAQGRKGHDADRTI